MSDTPITARLFKNRSTCSNSFDGVAQATNEIGEALCYINYSRIDNVFLITNLSVNPLATPEEAQRAGDIIDLLIEKQAHSAGVTALLIPIPGQDKCEEIRTYTRKIPTVIMGLGCHDSTPSLKFLN
jgi:hypothetical protein